jgi:hypothetical protein
MAKDEVTLLTDIAQQLKKLNQANVRQNLENKEYQERQLAQQSGDPADQEGFQGIDDATDFKRRIKASLFTAKMSEKFTDSGKRAKHSVKHTIPLWKKEQKDKKAKKKKPQVDRKDRFVGLHDLNEKLGLIKANSDPLVWNSIEIKHSLATIAEGAELKSIDKWVSLIKVNSDGIMHFQQLIKTGIQSLAAQGGKKGSLFVHDIYTEKLQKSALKQAFTEWKEKRKQRMDDKRSAIEAKREQKREIVEKAAEGMNITNITKGGKKAGILGTLAKLFFLAKALPYLLGLGAVALATGAIKDFVKGWKVDGLAGGIGQMLGGSGEGIWNAIKQSFKVGGLGATIGGAIGFLFGGVGAIPGAIIGGLIGMAIGAVAGYFGGDRITTGLKDAGEAVSIAWEKTKTVVVDIAKGIGRWIYTPGGKWYPGGTTKTKIFGGFISWESGNFSIAEAWQSAKDSLTKLWTSIKLWFWNEEEKTILGGNFGMPDWMISVKDSIGKVWQGLKDFGGLVKDTLIGMLPDWLTDHLGWTVDGKVPSKQYYRPTSSVGGNVKKALENQGISVAEMAEETGYQKTRTDLNLGVMVLMNKVLDSQERLWKYGMPGSDKWIEMLPHIWAEQRAAMGINTLGVQDLTHKNKTEEMKLQLRKKEESGLSYYDGKQRSTDGKIHNHSTQDFSSNKGAVTVIQHLHMDGSPTIRTLIHDYHTSSEYGMGPSMFGFN